MEGDTKGRGNYERKCSREQMRAQRKQEEGTI